MLWVAMSPKVEPPQACRMPALSMTQLAALRTWRSSNGGVIQFMVMYQVRSPSLLCRNGFLAGSVRYCWSTGLGGWSAIEESRSPAWMRLKMSSTLVSTVTGMASTEVLRVSLVVWVVVGVAGQGEALAGVEAGDRLHRPAGRDVELVGALDHVRPAGHDVAAVVTGLREALGDLFGDRRGGAHAEPVHA